MEHPTGDWKRVSTEIVRRYSDAWSSAEGKITLGISAYGFDAAPRDVQKTGILLKQTLKKAGISLRLIPNTESYLNTATSHHNKLGLSPNKVELLVVRGKSGRIIVAESTGAQNITALAARDQGRPKRDPLVGMLPPKLAQIMINLATGHLRNPHDVHILDKETIKQATPPYPHLPASGLPTLLDPFCGTGVVLQEAALMGFNVYGPDKSEKMVDYTKANIDWLKTTRHLNISSTVHQGDATTTTWQQPIHAVVCETYLGPAYNRYPGDVAVERSRRVCGEILSGFFANISPQLPVGTPVCIAVPNWFEDDDTGTFRYGSPPIFSPHYRPDNYELTYYSEIMNELGFEPLAFTHADHHDLVYRRPGQVVGRALEVLIKR
jgi:tRNA G10  N-methylase Trm11